MDNSTRYVELTVADETEQGAVETVYYAPIDLVRAKFDGFLTSLEREIAGASREVQLFYGALFPLLVPLYGLGNKMVKSMGLPPLPKRERGQDPLFLMLRYVADIVAETVLRLGWTFKADADGVIYQIDSEPLPCEDCPADPKLIDAVSDATTAESLESEPAGLN